ncbi:alkaline phosphatase D family protein [Actinoplanes awajinensis]|uniref:PhoD-like phosphatase metallophosphatase domain-containing protein n=1 Tax=Actinoplanes awajinensis subsp. mycoplanecinus TaxID=135947 RepID=A0A0X3V335_9ACTN|nr:alkaline phosphatase D family protein [Actinoplanes awajinensis]KUL39104.1 hypothetical protein ADL15_10190 [Actinoplanes awajinensis subsp. mycoplanecinus]
MAAKDYPVDWQVATTDRMAQDHPDLILHLGDYVYEGKPVTGRPRRHAGTRECLSLADYRLRHAQYKSGASIQLYRRVRWGRLATFHMLDTRQFRQDQPCGDGEWKVCAAADAPGRTITGAAQESWLLNGLAQHYATWDVLAQQVFFARWFDRRGGACLDGWDGYRSARARLQRGWRDRQVRNPVVLTGDVHRGFANDLKADYAQPRSATVGTELVCTSISSDGDGTAVEKPLYADVNPHLRYYSERRGYTLTTIGKDSMRVDFRTLSHVSRAGAPARTARTVTLVNGVPGVH